MECFVFKSRIFFGTIAAAGILAATAAAPAMASPRPVDTHRGGKPVDIVGAVTAPLKNVTGGLTGVAGIVTGGAVSAAPVSGLLGGLAGLPLIGPLFAVASGTTAPGAQTTPIDPVSTVLHGVTGAVAGVGSGAGAANAVNSAVNSVTGALKSVPVLGQIAGALPGAGSVTGALSGITSAVPGANAVTSLLQNLGG